MNKEQMTQEQRAQLIEKLRAEYNDLNGKIARLNAFLCDIDFEKRVPDPVEQRLMREQLHMMLGYMDNLRARISYNEEQQIRNRLETGDGKRSLDFVRCDNGKVFAIVPEGLIPKSPDDIDLIFEVIKKSWCDYKGRLEDSAHHCGQDASCQVGDGSAAVDKPVITGESLKQLMDYQVIGVCEPGFPCEGCVQDHYNTPCVKVELVGGYYICMAPLPNSIITE